MSTPHAAAGTRSTRTLLIVESPKKAKAIAQYLSGVGQYTVEASRGHFCDLATNDLLDRETWDEQYVLHPQKAATIKALKAKLRAGEFGTLLLATDPDREGEAISWHLLRELSPPKSVTVGRVRYRELTETAVRGAVATPDQLDGPLVEAQRARRCIDRVVGYDVSNAVQRINAKSAGRVQTPCNHLICERERAILAFVSVNYWTVAATYEGGVKAALVALPDGRTPQPAPSTALDAVVALDEMTDEEAAQHAVNGATTRPGGASMKRPLLRFFVEAEALACAKSLEQPTEHRVAAVRSTPVMRKPYAPYTTSTFVQDAYRKFGASTEKAMAVAQALYEAGLISYHRTDATTLGDDAVAMLRARIQSRHPEILPAKPPTYANKASAQEGHEAIRPSKIEGVNERVVMDALGADGALGWKLWRLITARALASQCKSAELLRTVITITTAGGDLELDGQTVKEFGFLHYWQPYADDAERLLPAWTVGDLLIPAAIATDSDRTKSLSRYNEASFNKKIDALGIGRPSTLATILATLRGKGYIIDIGTGRNAALQPTALGLLLDDALRFSFPDLVTAAYTANMETALDAISNGALERTTYLSRDFYPPFEVGLRSAKVAIEAMAAERGIVAKGSGSAIPLDRTCPRCQKHHLQQLVGKDGRAFVCCVDRDCGFTQPHANSAWKDGGCAQPNCGGTIVEYAERDGTGTYWRCARCKAFADSERDPLTVIDRQCPKCHAAPLVLIPRKQPAGVKPKAKAKTLPPWAACQAKCGFIQDSADTPWREAACQTAGCSGTLVQRQRDDRLYWKCATCDATVSADGTVSRYQRTAPVVGCPKCHGHPGMSRMLPRNPDKDRPFDACNQCRLAIDITASVTAVPCPTCGNALVTKQRRPDDPKTWVCVDAPTCTQVLAFDQIVARSTPWPPGPVTQTVPVARTAATGPTGAATKNTTTSATKSAKKAPRSAGATKAVLPTRAPGRRPPIPE